MNDGVALRAALAGVGVTGGTIVADVPAFALLALLRLLPITGLPRPWQ